MRIYQPKVENKIETHILYSVFFLNRAVYEINEKILQRQAGHR